ncbi:hypothetical protein DAEQUDRAFT_591758 [Daedalea quercina L-15889]|uniref:Uncharacterized protein n=1 Tax=Daedalea quercina L-15889 TaxID=1314783 RepID=A0A165SWF1_9APHY|nr:hypothetical protein DAEQUDRAFT_591758 [Daedalea quercina L-15889]
MKDVLERGSPPIHILDEKKIKRDHVWDEDLLPFHPAKRKRSPTYDPELLTFGGDPTSGSEFRSIARPTDSQTVNTIIIQTTRELAAVGKRLVRAPQLLDNGIAFDWVRDDNAKQESVSSLLSITGIDPIALESALQRIATSSTSEKGGGQAAAAIIIDPLSDHGSDIGDGEPAVQAVNLDGADAAHPIIIDTDEDTDGEQSEQSVANKDGTEVSQLPSRSGQIITGVACHPHAERSTHVANEAGPSQQRPPDTYSGEVEETSGS